MTENKELRSLFSVTGDGSAALTHRLAWIIVF